MKYTTEIEIGLPRARVVALFDDPENLKQWQEGLVGFEPLEGEPGHPGARSRLVYDMNGRRVEMVETVTERDLPDRFAGTYEMQGVFNVVDNRFEAVDEGHTRWTAHHEFRFDGVMMRLMGLLAPGIFKKQTRKMMTSFRDFAEAHGT